MRRLILLPVLLLACASAGFWPAQEGKSESRSNQRIEATSLFVKRLGSGTVYGSEGTLQLNNLTLTRMMTSAVLKGELFNKTNHSLDEMAFEIKAYDGDGKLLKGIEEKTIFTARQLKPHASTSLNSGYGVWLQGIPLNAVARIEISETNNENAASSLIRMIPFASHAAFWKDYSEIEE